MATEGNKTIKPHFSGGDEREAGIYKLDKRNNSIHIPWD